MLDNIRCEVEKVSAILLLGRGQARIAALAKSPKLWLRKALGGGSSLTVKSSKLGADVFLLGAMESQFSPGWLTFERNQGRATSEEASCLGTECFIALNPLFIQSRDVCAAGCNNFVTEENM